MVQETVRDTVWGGIFYVYAGQGSLPRGQESAQRKGGGMARGLVQGWGEGKKVDIQIYSLQPSHTSWGFHTLVIYKFINEKVDIC